MGEKSAHYNVIESETIFRIGDYIAQYAVKLSERCIKIILHGGEPTLADSIVYESFFDYVISRYPLIEWNFAIQTNGYHISDEYISLLKKYDVSVGVSIDGSKKVHDSIRVNADGAGTYIRVIGNIEKMLSEEINVSALIVVSDALLDEDLSYLDYFNDLGIALKINPLLKIGAAETEKNLWLSEGDYSYYLQRVYKYAVERELDIEINPISDMLRSIICKVPMHDCSYKQVCGKKILCIDYKGDIYPCNRFCGVGSSRLGNICHTNDVFEFCENRIDEECQKCRYLKWCFGGCSAYRTILNVSKTPLCTDIKNTFDYLCDEGLAKYITYLKNKKIRLESELKQRSSQ